MQQQWSQKCFGNSRPDFFFPLGLRFFDTFIKERCMYYVCGNIIKPLTKPFQLSWAELVGSTPMEWFVSHYWGMAARHLGEAVRKHAQSTSAEWLGTAYWICTFSNSQWHVRAELGNGQWQERLGKMLQMLLHVAS